MLIYYALLFFSSSSFSFTFNSFVCFFFPWLLSCCLLVSFPFHSIHPISPLFSLFLSLLLIPLPSFYPNLFSILSLFTSFSIFFYLSHFLSPCLLFPLFFLLFLFVSSPSPILPSHLFSRFLSRHFVLFPSLSSRFLSFSPPSCLSCPLISCPNL